MDTLTTSSPTHKTVGGVRRVLNFPFPQDHYFWTHGWFSQPSIDCRTNNTGWKYEATFENKHGWLHRQSVNLWGWGIQAQNIFLLKPPIYTHACSPISNIKPPKAIANSKSNIILVTTNTSCHNIMKTTGFISVFPNGNKIDKTCQGFFNTWYIYLSKKFFILPHIWVGGLVSIWYLYSGVFVVTLKSRYINILENRSKVMTGERNKYFLI